MEIETDGCVIIPDELYGDAVAGVKPRKRFAVHPSCRPRVRSAKESTVWYVLKDWNTECYLRLPNPQKGESGDGWLVDNIKTCTVFPSADVANRVAVQVEGLFWKPVYAKMNLHVCPLKDELPEL